MQQRIVLKLSGEALLGPNHTFPYDPETLLKIALEIKEAHGKGREIAVVVGGGNIFRGANGASKGMDRGAADWLGMLATVQNGIALRDLLIRKCRIDARLMTAFEIRQIAEPYLYMKAIHHLEKGRVIILGGGTGNPFCTTDYAAALRACEIKAQLVAKATTKQGVFSKDPDKDPTAQFLPRVSFNQCIRDDLRVMDTEAFALCRDQNIPIRVFSLEQPGSIVDALTGADIGSLVSSADEPAP